MEEKYIGMVRAKEGEIIKLKGRLITMDKEWQEKWGII